MDSSTGETYGNYNETMKMSYEFLKTITNGFAQKLGSGMFGVVYKGALPNGKEIAVKVLNGPAALDDVKFNNEFHNLARLKHPNIVELLGYCSEFKVEDTVDLDGKNVKVERKHVALCFEYVENGNLHPFTSGESQLRNWDECYKIIKGICEGLKHLREGLDKPVWHLDLKPDNILLDSNMRPKIADFGLSRLIGDEKTRKTMNSVGTWGYCPPEYIEFQLISGAFDIFSLGVIITKIMVGTKGYHDCADMRPRKLANHVQNIWKMKLQETVRPESLELYCQQVKTCIEMATKCLSRDRTQRPQIQEIIKTLNEAETMMMLNIRLQNVQFHDGKDTAPSDRSIKVIPSSGGKDTSSCYGENGPNRPYLTPEELPFEFLRKITDGFSRDRLLGTGSTCKVYKGVYKDGQVVAVKVLQNHFSCSVELFHTVVDEHAKVNHENIVQLLGFTQATAIKNLAFVNEEHFFPNMPKRALCYEFLQNGSLEGYTDEYHALDWYKCYKIIKGTCDGLRYLHEGLPSPILHLNLKPSNILLDGNMVPKIGDIGLSRLMGGAYIRTAVADFHGTLRYLPPEFKTEEVISTKFDIYSLGITIIEMLTEESIDEEMTSHEIINLVLAKWRKRLGATRKRRSVEGYCQQVKKCIEIALACVEKDMHKRPSIGEIVCMLNETETLIPDSDYHKLLDVHPAELLFAVKPKKHASCLLHLQNKQDESVVFRLVSKNPKRYLTELPLYGVVPPRCTYTLSLTTRKQPQRSLQESDEGFELHSIAAVSDHDHMQYELSEYESLFNEAEDTDGDEVQEVTLKSVWALQGEAGPSDNVTTQPPAEVITTVNAKRVSSIDVHPTKNWFMTTHESGSLHVWNYETMDVLNPMEALDKQVYVAKFVSQEDWIVAGDSDGFIHVRSYDESRDATSFKAHNGFIMSLAVHPNDSYVLSSSDDNYLIKLWQWDKSWNFDSAWVCTRIFDGHSGTVFHATFNPWDMCSFATASFDFTAKIWNLDSDVSKTTFDEHLERLTCVDYFTGPDNQHCIITGSTDGTAQIWDLNTKRLIENLEGHTDEICGVYCIPELQRLITGSHDGTVRIWDSTTFRLQNVIAFNLGAVYGLGYIEDIQRIVVGCHEGIALTEINLPEVSVLNG